MFTTIILGAGKSTRMKANKSKLLFDIAGKPIIEHIVDSVQKCKSKNIICVVNKESHELVKLLKSKKVDVAYQKNINGTAGAAESALSLLKTKNSPVLILCGDAPFISSKSIRAITKKLNGYDACVGTVELDIPRGYGRIIRFKNKIVEIVEEKDTTVDQRNIREVNTGVIAIKSNLLTKYLSLIKNNNIKKEFYLTDIIKILISNNHKVTTFKFHDELEVKGVNSKVDLVNLEQQYILRKAEHLLETGTLIRDPSRTHIRGNLSVQKNVEIDINCVFEDTVTIGENTRIGHNCYFNRCKIGKNVHIKPNTIIFGSTINNNCIVGPYARIRPGTKLEDDVHVGNFVEIKKSIIGRRTKVNHLSYIGDAKLGSDINIGAGTITCNYDGEHKHKTVIESDSFIGSGTRLVAPVKVKKGSYIGAGSTVTKDTPGDGSLTIARAKQVSIHKWKNKQIKGSK
ncbi:MAG: bifunctional protein GlmU [Ectothiorhodospiraceae bacterium]|nr:MAG: bifunctional protein GlmU [Ectothiorhodospiraceae bacterium]